MAATHPIVACFEQLHGQWTQFVGHEPGRLLVWQAADEELALVDGFIAKECDADSAETPDLFVRLEAPFTRERGHGHVLAAELMSLHEEATRADPQAEQTLVWRRAPAHTTEADEDAFLRALESLRAHLVEPNLPAKLCVWLDPETVSSWEPYLLWLHRLTQKAPPTLRFLVVETLATPRYAPLVAVASERVRVVPCNLNLLAALEEVAAGAEGGTPGGLLRSLQTRFAARLAAGDFAAAARAATQGHELALSQGWPQLAAAMQMMLAAAHSAQGKASEAVRAYAEAERLGALREAQEAAAPAEGAEAAVGAKLRLQASLGQGAVLLGCGAYRHAAEAYERSAGVAHQLHDAPAELDAWRLASHARLELGESSAAWELGMRGFQLGVDMPLEVQRTSTLAYLAAHLLRLTERQPAYAAYRRPLEEHLTRILGPSWRQQLAAAG